MLHQEPERKFKRIRSRHVNDEKVKNERSKLKEMIFLRDLHFGFLPDDCEIEFADCFSKIADDIMFASKCFRLALLSRNEDLLTVLLDHLDVTKNNFQDINATFLDSQLLLEAVELEDMESIQSILAWRDAKGTQLGLTNVDKKLLKMQKTAQEVIISAAVKNNYSIIKLLYADGYRIFGAERIDQKKKYFLRAPSFPQNEDMMESHIDKIRSFKAMASPAYMAMTYLKDPIDHAFDFTRRAEQRMLSEPEFKTEYDSVREKCRKFAVSILDSCRNSEEVEQVLNGNGLDTDRAYARLYRALHEDQKEFVSHPYCQVLLHAKWMNGSPWSSQYFLMKFLHVTLLILMSPLLCLLYILSPNRDHSKINSKLGWFIKVLDRPINRFILDISSYMLFLYILLLSVLHVVGNGKVRERTWYLDWVIIFVTCFTVKLWSQFFQIMAGRITLNKFKFFFDLINIILFQIAIGFTVYGYQVGLEKAGAGAHIMKRNEILGVYHPINIGANIYGVASCMAFLKVIFIFEIHYRFGPILFCIKNVFWDILSIILSYVITVIAFSVGLVSIFGIFDEQSPHFQDFRSSLKTLFWIIFDPGKEEYADIEPAKETTPSGPLGRPFVRPGLPINMATTRPPMEGVDKLSHGFGIYIWAFYQVFVVLIMLNLLVSLMTNTFARIQKNADVEWKFSRASTWIHYYDDLNSMPAPFNIIPSVYSLKKLIFWCCRKQSNRDKTWKSSLLMSQESNRKIYDTLIERVFREEEKRNDARVGKSDIDNLEKEIAIDIADLRRDIRNLKRDLKIPTTKFIKPRDGYATRKVSAVLKVPKCIDGNLKYIDDSDSEEEGSSGKKTKTLGKKLIDRSTSKSFKVDNSPEVVQHLVQTLGLIGVSTEKLDKNVQNEQGQDRRNSFV